MLGQENDLVDLQMKPVGDLLVDVIGEEMFLPYRNHGGVADALDEASFILSPDREISFFEQPIPYVNAGDVLQAQRAS